MQNNKLIIMSNMFKLINQALRLPTFYVNVCSVGTKLEIEFLNI